MSKMKRNEYPNIKELEKDFKVPISSISIVKTHKTFSILTLVIVLIIILFSFSLIYIPWVQTVKGEGKVIAYSPNERIQAIAAPIDGRIEKWYVTEGGNVQKGDKIVDLSDIDPDILKRLEREEEAAQLKLEATQKAAETSKNNIKRQYDLFKKGLSSKRAYELAELEYAKFLSELSSASAELARIETRLARQSSQEVVAPLSGILQRVVAPQGGTIVKLGQELAMIVPETKNRAVELYISGLDLPLLSIGREVRLQFEGWPAVQFSGWPSVAVGTFSGRVSVIDPSDDGKGKFRILVRPEKEEDWPDTRYLRQGVRTVGWVLLDSVRLGWELWRQFNGFPMSVKNATSAEEKKR